MMFRSAMMQLSHKYTFDPDFRCIVEELADVLQTHDRALYNLALCASVLPSCGSALFPSDPPKINNNYSANVVEDTAPTEDVMLEDTSENETGVLKTESSFLAVDTEEKVSLAELLGDTTEGQGD